MRVTGLITQGAKRIGSPEYVKSYKVAYSDDGKSWRTYKVKGKDEDMVRRTDTGAHVRCHPLLLAPRRTDKRHTLAHVHTQRLETALSQGRSGGHDEMAF